MEERGEGGKRKREWNRTESRQFIFFALKSYDALNFSLEKMDFQVRVKKLRGFLT